MDPDACLTLYRMADDADERAEHAHDLASWLAGGGFEPKWTPEQEFWAFVEGNADLDGYAASR